MPKGRGSSKAGRPRKDGDRHPCGKLKAPSAAENERIIAARAAKPGSAPNLAPATEALDVALARGWISVRQHKTAAHIADVYASSRIGAPGLGRGGPRELEEGTGIDKAWSDMTRQEKAAVWDKAFNIVASDRHQRTAEALERWKLINEAMTPDEAAEVFRVCVLVTWPPWVSQRMAGAFDSSWEHGRALLVAGLDKVAGALWPRPAAPTIWAVPDGRKPRSPKSEQRVNYVDQHGQPLFPTGSTGRPFEVAVRTRRSAPR